MTGKMNYVVIDAILNLFYDCLPSGGNYFTLTYRMKLEAQEWEDMFDFLVAEQLIELWDNADKYIISKKGIMLIKRSHGIEKYLKWRGK